jgi:AmmeMemoRadiSam system protein A
MKNPEIGSPARAIVVPIARAAIGRAFGLPDDVDESAGFLREVGASFVTLLRGAELRGCIGTVTAYRPLLRDLRHNALAAAFKDPRFSPLTKREFTSVTVEVSLLSDLRHLRFEDESDALLQLRPLVDGVLLKYRDHRGTFLPQVWDRFPEPREFLGQLKRKAGLSSDFWDDEVRLSCYAVAKFTETLGRLADEPLAERPAGTE